ncbi:MAG: hypothetical protein LAO19_21840 [Acidobacteriia bacterium]|nr:hypothetical protein [Terriglobia bacterium]
MANVLKSTHCRIPEAFRMSNLRGSSGGLARYLFFHHNCEKQCHGKYFNAKQQNRLENKSLASGGWFRK